MKILFFLFLVDLQIELCFYFSRYSFLCYTIFVFFVPFIFLFCFRIFIFSLLLLCLWTCSVFLDIQVMLFFIECLLWSFQGILLLAWWSGFGLVVNTSGGVEIFFMISSTWVLLLLRWSVIDFILLFRILSILWNLPWIKMESIPGFFGLCRSKNTAFIFLEREEQESSYYFLHFVYASRLSSHFRIFDPNDSFAFRVVF